MAGPSTHALIFLLLACTAASSAASQDCNGTTLNPGESCTNSSGTIPYNANSKKLNMTCHSYYAVHANDSCPEISSMYGICTSDFWDWNPWVQFPECPVVEGFSYCIGADHTCGQSMVVGPSDTCATLNNNTGRDDTGGNTPWGNLTERNPQIAAAMLNGSTCDEVLKSYRGSRVCVGD
ncbi:hypothetical protein B0H14DRAFT_2556654 [Mycena olivaceomarginata]|nr:hypothetical protein B0H14DRAFT_2556654 [Mycena olivaceomarginata]